MRKEKTAAVAPATHGATLKDWLKSDVFRQALREALPKYLTVDRYVRVVLTTLMRTPRLSECSRDSVLGALLQCSAMGLEPDGRQAHLVPFWNSKTNRFECQLIVDYKGLVDLVYRSGVVARVYSEMVCETDEFEFDRGFITKHKIDFRRARGKAYAYFSIVTMKDGGEICAVMTRDEIDQIRKRSKAANNGPWVDFYDEMAKKTVFKRLVKWIPLSGEVRDALRQDDEAEYRADVETAEIAPELTYDQLQPSAEANRGHEGAADEQSAVVQGVLGVDE